MAWLPSVFADFRYAVRSLAASPGLALTAMVSLAAGLVAAAVSVSVVDSLGLRPLAVTDPDSLVRVSLAVGRERGDRSAADDITSIESGAPAFAGVAGESMRGAGLVDSAGPPAFAMVDVVTANYFTVLGVRPVAGRALAASDDDPAATPVVMLSESLWRQRYGGDAAVVGRTIELSGSPVTVAGIVPASFGGLNQLVAPDLWLPRHTWQSITRTSVQAWTISSRRDREYAVVARLANGVTLATAQAQLDATAAALGRERPDIRREARLTAEMDRAARARPALNLRAVAGILVGLVVLVGCANVTGLLLGRSELRRGELALRAALGASRTRLVRQLLAESVVLASGAAAIGLAGGWWLIRSAPAFLPPIGVPLALDFRFDAHVVVDTVLASLATVIVFGVFPALTATRADLTGPLKLDRAGAFLGGRLVFRRVLVAGQVAVATALVVTSGLLVRSLQHAEEIPLGFSESPALLVTVSPPAGVRSAHDVAGALAALPGVTGVTMARRIPLAPNGGGATREVDLPGGRGPDGRLPQVHFNAVAPNYFRVMGTRLVEGPGFAMPVGPSDPRMVVINEAMAQKYWPKGDAVGRSIQVTGAGSFEIAGVVETGKYLDVTESPDPYMFFSFDQMPSGDVTFVISTPRPADLGPVVRTTLTRLDARMPVMSMLTLDQHVGFALYQFRTVAGTSAWIGGAGLGLSLIGLYAVISFVVTRRRREIGIRMALGATPRDVMRGVLRESALVAGVGMLLGFAVVPLAATSLSSSMVGTPAVDLPTYVGAAVVIAAACLIAVWQPGRRAAHVDPAVTLRD